MQLRSNWVEDWKSTRIPFGYHLERTRQRTLFSLEQLWHLMLTVNKVIQSPNHLNVVKSCPIYRHHQALLHFLSICFEQGQDRRWCCVQGWRDVLQEVCDQASAIVNWKVHCHRRSWSTAESLPIDRDAYRQELPLHEDAHRRGHGYRDHRLGLQRGGLRGRHWCLTDFHCKSMLCFPWDLWNLESTYLSL